MDFNEIVKKYTDENGNVNYNNLCRAETIDENYLINNFDQFKPDLVSACQKLSSNTMNVLYKKIDWETASKYQIIPDDIASRLINDENRINQMIRKNLTIYQKHLSKDVKEDLYKKNEIARIKKNNIFGNGSYTPADVEYKPESLVAEICSHLNYYSESYSAKEKIPSVFSLDMIEALSSHIDWYFVSKNINLPEPFINKYKDKVSWYLICKYQNLSETFILEHANYVDWTMIWQNQHIREKYIDIFDKIDDSEFKWKNICTYQRLSKEFIEDHVDKVDWDLISIYQSLSKEFIEKYADKVNWKHIYKYQFLDTNFIIDHSDRFSEYL